MSLALYAYACGVLARAAGRGVMTREEAARLVSSLLGAHGVGGGARLFEGRRVVGVMLGAAELFFEYEPEGGALACAALVYRFHDEPRAGLLEAFFAEEEQGAADAGGGALEYRPEARSLLLARSYSAAVPGEEFAQDMRRLAAASLEWGGEVLERVAARAGKQS